jgi:hypothetical protein
MFPYTFFPVYMSFPEPSEFQIEICSIANGATKKEIGRAKEYIVKQLGLENGGQSVEMGTIHAGDFMVSLLYCCVLVQHNFLFQSMCSDVTHHINLIFVLLLTYFSPQILETILF